jgi:transcriptional regulator of nitric oxide reductase
MDSVRCSNCGLVNFGETKTCNRCGYDFASAAEFAAANPHRRKIILSTGEIPFDYKIIDVVFAYGHSSQTFFRGANPMEAYQRVSDILEQTAAQIGAEAVLWVKYDYRVALSSGLVTTNQVFEVFAYGTAVKIVR